MTAKYRIGVFSHSLHGARPRGFQRVARTVTQELLELLPPDAECYCLLHKVDRQQELTYEACDLREWLARNPLITPARTVGRVRRLLEKVAGLVVPPVFWRLKDRATANLRRLVARGGATTKLRQRLGKLKRILTKAQPPLLGSRWLTLDELNVVISYEPFDDIWNEPTHRCQARFISFFHDAIPKRIDEGPNWNPDRFDAAVTNACYRAHRIVCISRSAEADLLTYFPIADGKTRVVYIGHDRERFARAAEADRETVDSVFRKHRISRSVPYLFALGAIEPRKNTANILRACELVRNRHPRLEFQLLFAGDTSTDRGLARLLKRVQRSLTVRMLPYSSDADAAILTAHARGFLYPSLWEGFGIPPLEAMSAGTLTVVGDISAMPEVSGPHAIYCDPYDVHEMADAFYQALTMDDKHRQRHTAEAQQHAAHFTWSRTAKKLLSVIDEELAINQRLTHDHGSATPQVSQCA